MVTVSTWAQVEFTAKAAKDEVALNERLKVVFEMNENGDNFTPPSFDGFKIYAGPSQSISQSWVNGKSSFSKSYTYYLEPEKRGTYTIGQAKVTVKGTEYKTSPITIRVTGAVDKPKDEEGREIKDVTAGIHLVAEVSNPNPYKNEGFLVTYKLYVSADAAVSDWGFSDIPKFSNFWSHDIKLNDYQIKYGSYNGDKDYRYVVLKQTMLYPQKSGELTIDPLTLKVVVDVPTHRRDFFGRTLYDSQEKTIASQSRKIAVKALPEKGKPANFSGAVGDFKLNLNASKEELETDESVDVSLQVSGRGNLKLFSLPEMKVPQAFEAYDPEHSEQVVTNANGSQGKVSDIYTLVPNVGGEYAIEPIKFSYFDPSSKSYKTLTSERLHIKVKGNGSRALAGNTGESDTSSGIRADNHKQVINTKGKQFRYIKLKTTLHELNPKPFFRSGLFWSLLAAPIVLLPIILLAGNKQREKARDITANRLKRANKLARKYLSEAKNKIGDQKGYYDALERALYNYLKAKLNMSVSELSKERIVEVMQNKHVSEKTSKDFISLLAACEFARYTPSSDVGMQQDYDKAADIIARVDKELKE